MHESSGRNRSHLTWRDLVVAELVLSLSAATALPDVAVTVRTVDAEAICGRLESLTLEAGLRVHDESNRLIDVPAADLVQVATSVRPTSPPQAAITLRLGDGGVLHGTITGGSEAAISLARPNWPSIQVPREQVAGLLAPHARADPKLAQLERRIARARGAQDEVLLVNDDRLLGKVRQIDAKGITIESQLGRTKLAFEALLGVAFGRASPATAASNHEDGRAELRAALVFADGSRVIVSSLNWTGQTIRALFFGAEHVSIGANELVRVEIAGGRWRWLSELTPTDYQHTPMMSLAWPWRQDRNVLGGSIRVDGRAFEHGIGMHSQSRLTYELAGRYQRFVSYFGLDDDSGPLGDVGVEVRVDGQPRFAADHVRLGKLHGPIHVDVAGAKRLELVVAFGANGDIQDRLDWADAALVRPPRNGH